MTAVTGKLVPEETNNVSSPEKAISIRIVRGFDDLHKALAVRAAVFLGKPGWTYEHTFDPNDHAATQILAEVDGEPVGTIRVRWFNGFARIERVAILPEHRSLRVLRGLAQKALKLAQSKGYELVCGLAYPEIVAFWRRQGGEPCGEAIESEYGSVIPMLMRLKGNPEIVGPDLANIGKAAFEWNTYAPEGQGL
jgi:predicted GNAT family N-acyltransferase